MAIFGHFWPFLAILGLWGHSGPIPYSRRPSNGPQMAILAPDGPKWPKMAIFGHFGPFWAILGLFLRCFGEDIGPGGQKAQNGHFWPF